MLIIFAHLISEQKEKINSLTTIIKIGILYVIPMLLVSIGARSVDNACFCIFILYNDVCGRSQLQDHRYHIGDIGTVGRTADLVYSAAGTDFTPWLSASENFDVP